MTDFLKKGLRYRIVPGGAIRVWVPPVVHTETVRTYGPSVPIISAQRSVQVGNCRTVDLRDFEGDGIDGSGVPEDFDEHIGNFFIQVCEYETVVLENSYTSDILTIRGPLLSVTTTTVVDEAGYFETVTAAPTLEPVLNLGWNASAVSEPSFINNGKASFQIRTATIGAVVGLTTYTQAPRSEGYQDIHHAFYIERGTYQIVEKNQFKTVPVAFSIPASFEIEVIEDVVTYRVDGLDVSTSPSTLGTNDVVLDAALYAGGDQIDDGLLENLIENAGTTTYVVVGHPPEIVFGGMGHFVVNDGVSSVVFSGKSTFSVQLSGDRVVTIGAISPEIVFGGMARFVVDDGVSSVVFSGKSAFSVQQAGVPVSTVSVVRTGSAAVSFQPLQLLASDTAYNAVAVTFEPLQISASAGLRQISLGVAKVAFAPLSMSAGIYNNGRAELSFEPLQVLGYEGSYTEAGVAFEPLQVLGFDLPDLELGVARVVYNSPAGVNYGNGTLLRSGRHILTAAHVVELMVDVGFIEVQFFAGTKFNVELIPVESVLIHPGFRNTVNEIVNDIAIITLSEEAHPLIRRHDIYTGDSELGNVYTRLSYNPQFSPVTGVQLDPEFDRWTLSNNKFEVFNEDIENLIPNHIPSPNGSGLGYDYDDGTTLHDAFGNVFSIEGRGVENESFVQPGDSGSASFIGVDLIAGVTSYGVTLGSPPDILPGTNATYGEVAVDVRVSYYADWISENSGGVGAFEGSTAEACLLLPEFEIQAHATNVQTLTGGTLELPEFDIEGSTGAAAVLELFDLDIEASLTNYDLARANLLLPEFDIEAVAFNGSYAIANLFLPEFDIGASTGAVANLEFDFELTIEASSTVEAVAVANLFLPEFDIQATSTVVIQPTVANLELFELQAVYGVARCLELIQFEGFNESALVVNSLKAYSMNVLHSEITEYSNYPFDRIIRLDGDYYGIGADGIYLLRGADDDGVKIVGSVKTGRMDLGTAKLKRVPYVYIDSQDKTTIEAFVENVPIGKFNSNYEGRRTKLARGANGRFWSFKVSNIAGGKMDIRSLELYPNVLSRKVR